MVGTEVIHWSIPGEEGATWLARPYGQSLPDLDVDLRGKAAPISTTAVLCVCLADEVGAIAADQVWLWSVNRRLQGLLAVTIATLGENWIHPVRCARPDCSKLMDLPLRFCDFARKQDPQNVECVVPGSGTLRFRVPTGMDQLAWLEEGVSGEGAEVNFIKRLLREESDAWPEMHSEEAIKAVEAALEEADPLTVLYVETSCPECGHENRFPLDLERICLDLLAREQPCLLDDIHRLALAYHWSEAEILAIPPARRRHYLARLEEVWA